LFILNSFAYPIALLFPIAGQNSAKSFSKRAGIKGSENNKDDINKEEVRKELQEATKRGYYQALRL
jgi:hypothetical protein